MAARKTKKIITPEKDVGMPVNFASPITGDFVAAPYEQHPADELDLQSKDIRNSPLDMQCSEDQVNEAWRQWLTPVEVRVAQEKATITPDDEFERLYGNLTTQLPEIQRAMLRELVRIRCAVEAHF